MTLARIPSFQNRPFTIAIQGEGDACVYAISGPAAPCIRACCVQHKVAPGPLEGDCFTLTQTAMEALCAEQSSFALRSLCREIRKSLTAEKGTPAAANGAPHPAHAPRTGRLGHDPKAAWRVGP